MTDPDPARVPAGGTVQRVAFATERQPGQAVIVEFPAPVNRLAVMASDGPPKDAPQPYDDLYVLTVPAAADDADALARARQWAAAAARPDAPAQVLTLQGAQVVWAADRVAVLAPADRLEAVRRAAVEVAYFDAELRAIERELGELWPALEADAPLAFEFHEGALRDRKRLAERFRRVLLLRARLARISPHVLAPHAHPPTLASQVGERLRERARMPHRAEALGGQLEVFERAYEACGQRASDFALARTGHTLEWVIITLLLAQLVLSAVDLAGGAGR